MRKVIDADFEYVAGPMRVGDEHPTRRGWFFTDEVDAEGRPLWYRPPGLISRWVRRIGVAAFLALMALGLFVAFFVESPA